MDRSIIIDEADNINAATENSNLITKTWNDHKHQQNRKKNAEQEKDLKKSNKEQKKGKSVMLSDLIILIMSLSSNWTEKILFIMKLSNGVQWEAKNNWSSLLSLQSLKQVYC